MSLESYKNSLRAREEFRNSREASQSQAGDNANTQNAAAPPPLGSTPPPFNPAPGPNRHTGELIYHPQPIYVEPQIINNYCPEKRQRNGIGTTGFVFAVIGLFFACSSLIPLVGLIFMPFAVICFLLGGLFSFIGIFRYPRGLAVAGFVISILFLLWPIAVL